MNEVTPRDRAEAALARSGLALMNQSLSALMRGLFWGARGAEREPDRVVVHLIGNLGDVIVAIPALMALRRRFPQARLTLVTSPGRRGMPGAKELLSGVGWLDEMIVYHQEDIATRRAQLALAARIRALRPDLLIYLPASRAPARTVFRNLAFARLTSPRRVFGYYVPTFPSYRLAQARVFGRFPQEVDRHLRALAPLGIPPAPPGPFELGAAPAADVARVAEIVAAAGGRTLVAVCAGGKQDGHLWPPERFAAVAAALAAEGFEIVTVGGPGDVAVAERVLAAAGGGSQAAGALSILGSAELLRHAALLVTNDTGPMHIAAAVGTPVAAVFSSENFAGRWYPYGPGHEVLRAREVCEVCLFSGSRTGHCVDTIGVDDVLAACRRVLARRGGAAAG